MNEEFHNLPLGADVAFREAFPRAAELPWAVGVITGDVDLSSEQASLLLGRCGGLPPGLSFRPLYGHLAVYWCDTAKRDAKSIYVHLLPATDECYQAVGLVMCERWVEAFTHENRESPATAQSLWCDANGETKTLEFVAELWPWRRCSDIDVRKAGFLLQDPAEIDALEIVRRYPVPTHGEDPDHE